MTIFMRVFDKDTSVIIMEMPLASPLRYSYGLNASAQFSSEIPQNWPNSDLVEIGQAVEFRRGKTPFLAGNLQRVELTQGAMIGFTGMGQLDALYDEKAFGISTYEDLPLLGVLTELLQEAGWVLGDISSLKDPDQVTSINLRGEANLLVQINKLLSGVPELFYREGDFILGSPSLDIGTFKNASGIRALNAGRDAIIPEDNLDVHWVENLSYQEDVSQAAYAVHAIGGPVTDQLGIERVINLGDAVDADIAHLFDADFPIIEDLAEQSWAMLNYQAYGRVGGIIRSTVDGTSDVIIGDNVGGGGESNLWQMQCFVPFPGIFESFALWFGAVTANALGFDLTWVLQEIDINDHRTVLADNLLTGTINTASITNSIQRVTLTEDFEFLQGKLYGLAIGFNFNPSPDVFNVRLRTRAAFSNSPVFRMQSRNGKATLGATWGASQLLGFLEVKSRAIEVPQASFVGETAAKYAPKNTGGMSGPNAIQKAGLALRLWTKAYLLDRLPNVKTYSMSTVGTKLLPKAGDTIYVNSKAYGYYVDPISQEVVQTQRQVLGNLRVDKAQVEIEGESVKIQYELLDGLGIPRTSLIVDLYDRSRSQIPDQGDVAARPWSLLLDTLSLSVGPVNPDTVLSNGRFGYRVSVSIYSGAYLVRPANVEMIYLAGLPFGTLSTGGDLLVELASFPSLVTGLLVFDISLKNRNWVYGDIADLTVKLIWR